MDIPAITKTVKRKLKQGLVGKSNYGNSEWKKADPEWYRQIHDANLPIHEDFIRYLKQKKDIETVLEIGCGTGIYPIRHEELFNHMQYTGLDISESNIEYCKEHSNSNFICCDFLKSQISDYDLIFSHAVIDHVYDIDGFVSKIAATAKKYAYINSYGGYFPSLKKHVMDWRDNDGCFYNHISIPRTVKMLQTVLADDEFRIRPITNMNGLSQTIIEINKK